PTDRVWTRDYLSLFVRDRQGGRLLLEWQFNGWAKYDNWRRDNVVKLNLRRKCGWRHATPAGEGRPLVLEGGGVEVNGAGLLLTTEEWLLSDVQVRNPGLTRTDYERVFAAFLGAHKTIWLGQGIAGDDTHGHIDDLARFVSASTIVTVVE